MYKTVDPRIKKTRRFIREAMIALIDEKGFDAITVRDLTERAEINRATFYKHYKDKFDLLDQNIEEKIGYLSETVGPIPREGLFSGEDETSPIFVNLFKYISNNARFFRVMLGENGVFSFRNQMLHMIQQLVSSKLDVIHPEPDKLEVPKDIFIHYISSAHLGVIIYWLETDMMYSPNYMAKQLSHLTAMGPVSAIGLIDKTESHL